jgi:hypothetical protein
MIVSRMCQQCGWMNDNNGGACHRCGGDYDANGNITIKADLAKVAAFDSLGEASSEQIAGQHPGDFLENMRLAANEDESHGHHLQAHYLRAGADEIERLRHIADAARVQWEAYGAYPGLIAALQGQTS